jgi:hypothetical protein
LDSPRYFGIALTLDELHKILGLPEDVKIVNIQRLCNILDESPTVIMRAGLIIETTAEHYTTVPRTCTIPFHRPDIRTSTVSQVVIHPLRER